MQRRWIFPTPERNLAVNRLSRDLGIPVFLASILVRNGLAESLDAENFLQPKLKNLSDPFLLPDMAPAVARVREGIARGESIVLYGDYDVDGVASLTLLQRVLTTMGGKVRSFLPHRVDEGYGLS